MKTITITVEGGIIQSIDDIPADVRVVVRDFDTEGIDDLDRLKVCGDGWREYVETVWTAEDGG